jgi:CRP-like cAMP-binding protein
LIFGVFGGVAKTAQTLLPAPIKLRPVNCRRSDEITPVTVAEHRVRFDDDCRLQGPPGEMQRKRCPSQHIDRRSPAGIRGTSMAAKTDSFDLKSFLSKVGAGKTILHVRKNQSVFAQGDEADSVYYIQKGRIKLTVLSSHGKEAVVGILEPGQFFGENCLNGHDIRLSTTTAMEDCVVTAITRTALLEALHNEPGLSELFMKHLLTRNSRIEEDLIDQLFNSSEKRLARLLLLLANFGKEGTQVPVLVNISQETLAEMIGTTRSRVSFFMNKFRKLGFISYNGKIEVHTSLLNAVLRDKPRIESDDTPNLG